MWCGSGCCWQGEMRVRGTGAPRGKPIGCADGNGKGGLWGTGGRPPGRSWHQSSRTIRRYAGDIRQPGAPRRAASSSTAEPRSCTSRASRTARSSRTTDGQEFHDPRVVAADFAAMAAHGVNSVRTYTVPPRWLLDLAGEQGLSVLVGMPWEQHVTFLDDRARARSIVKRVQEGVASCAGHPAVLAYTLGNEIPAPIVRWHGRHRIERFVERLYDAAKRRRPGGARHLRQLPLDRVPRAPVPRPVRRERVPRGSRPARRVPCAPAEPGRRPAAPARRGRPRQPAQRRGEAGGDPRLAAANRLRSRLRRHVRVLVDRRVAPRRPRDRGLGLRPHRPGDGIRSRLSRPSRARSPRCRSPMLATGRASRSSSAPTTGHAR